MCGEFSQRENNFITGTRLDSAAARLRTHGETSERELLQAFEKEAFNNFFFFVYFSGTARELFHIVAVDIFSYFCSLCSSACFEHTYNICV